MEKSFDLKGLLAVGALAWGTAVSAGAPTPGGVQETLPAPRPVQRPQTPAQIDSPTSPTLAPVPAGGVKILIKGFQISGNTAIATAELDAQVATYVNSRLTLLEIYSVADQLTKYYRDSGYTLATVTVPEQQVSSGTVRLEVIEGRIGAVRLEGNRRYRARTIDGYLDRLVPGDVLMTKTLADELSELNRLPGLSTRAVIVPGAEYGTSDVVIRSQEKWFDAGLRLNNYGRESVGEWRVEADLIANSPLGIGDRIGASFVHAEGNLLNYGRIFYDLPINRRGTRVNVYYATYDYEVNTSDLGAAFRGTQLEGDGDDFGVGITHPLITTRNRNLSVGLAFERTLTTQDGTLVLPENRRDHMSLAVFSVDFDQANDNGSYTTARAQFRTNFEGNDTGLEKNAQAGLLRIDLSHYTPIRWQNWYFQSRFTGVVSIDPLSDLERFRLGGQGNVRGFPAAEVAGDQGLFMSFELHRRFMLARFPSLAKVFYDGGWVDRKEPQPGEKSDEGLQGVGIGLATELIRNISLNLEIVHPFGNRRVTDDRDDVRGWAGISAIF